MKKLVVIDGSALLSHHFYGNVPMAYRMAKTPEEKAIHLENIMRTSDGRPVNGLYGFMRALLQMLNKVEPSHLAIAWDITRDTFRRDIYPEYKATRSTTPEELIEQYKLSQETFRSMGIQQFYCKNYEADDYVGSLSKKFEEEIKVSVWTKDQDSLQLLSENTDVWYITKKSEEMYDECGVEGKDFISPRGTFVYTVEALKQIYSLKPNQIVDLKSLEGDSSDNIPGVKRIGNKMATNLLQIFETSEDVFKAVKRNTEKEMKLLLKECGATRAYKPLIAEYEDGTNAEYLSGLSKKLATIVTDIDEIKEVELDELELRLDEDDCIDVLNSLEMESLVKLI